MPSTREITSHKYFVVKPQLDICIITIPKEQKGFLEQYLKARSVKRQAAIISWFLLTQVDSRIRFYNIRRGRGIGYSYPVTANPKALYVVTISEKSEKDSMNTTVFFEMSPRTMGRKEDNNPGTLIFDIERNYKSTRREIGTTYEIPVIPAE